MPLLSLFIHQVAAIGSEQFLERVAALTGRNVRIGRLGTAYRPMERTTPSRSNMSAVHRAVNLAAAGGGQLRVTGTDFARDFCQVDDARETFWQFATSYAQHHLVRNVGAPQAAPRREALDALAGAVPTFDGH